MNKSSVKFVILICALISMTAYGYSNHIDRNPHYGKEFHKLGMQCQDECSPEKKLRYFQKAVYHDPGLIDAYYQMGIIHGQQGNEKKEIEYYQKITQLDHRHHNAHFKVALHYLQTREFDYAVRYLMQAGQSGHDAYVIDYYTAQAYEGKGMYDEAVDLYTSHMIGRSYYSAEACERIKQISKIPGQYDVVMKHINLLLGMGALKQEKLWQQVDEYIRTDKVPDFVRSQKSVDVN